MVLSVDENGTTKLEEYRLPGTVLPAPMVSSNDGENMQLPPSKKQNLK